MPNRFTRADVVEVPLPADYPTPGACLPLVVMQPAADISNYMLKSAYATNGQPGIVDMAVEAETVNSVNWGSITNIPAVFPPAPHALTHLSIGTDPIPLAQAQVAGGLPALNGLCPPGTGQPGDYLGGDIIFHQLPSISRFRSEGPVTIDAAFTAGTTIFSATINNPSAAVYEMQEVYLYAPNMTYPPSGMVHADIYDPAIPGWFQVTASTDISVMNTPTFLLRPILQSAAMMRVFTAGPNALSWRLVLDQATGAQCYFQGGIGVIAEGLTQLP
jgi:hypothetical protein